MIAATYAVTVSEARAIIGEFQKDARQYVVENVKADGKTRKWCINPLAGRRFINGNGVIAPTDPLHVKVFDMAACRPRRADGTFGPITENGWRTLNVATATCIKRGATQYIVV